MSRKLVDQKLLRLHGSRKHQNSTCLAINTMYGKQAGIRCKLPARLTTQSTSTTLIQGVRSSLRAAASLPSLNQSCQTLLQRRLLPLLQLKQPLPLQHLLLPQLRVPKPCLQLPS